MTAAQRRKLSWAEAAFWAIQIPPAAILLPGPPVFKYLTVVSQWALVRTAIAGAQADTPDDES